MSFSCPSENVSTVLRQFDTVLRSPALPAPRLEFYKAQVLDALQHQDDDADAQAFRWVQQQSEAAEISGHVTQNTYPAAAQY
eukprot:1150102-Pelagomonas_calceolata.AAC.3